MIKCNQQVNFKGKTKKENRFIKKTQHIYRRHGILGFYKGLCATINRDVLSYGLYFQIYYIIKDYYKKKSWEFTSSAKGLAGAFSGFVVWFITYPFDTIKTIIQTVPIKENKNIHQKEVFTMLYKQGGIIELYRGATPSLIYSCIFSGFSFIFFEFSNNILNKLTYINR
jgi:solute carrier family 25 carnitine/acylcarnitine transporter 20/29